MGEFLTKEDFNELCEFLRENDYDPDTLMYLEPFPPGMCDELRARDAPAGYYIRTLFDDMLNDEIRLYIKMRWGV